MNRNEQKFVSISKASEICGLHPITLRKMVDEGILNCFITPSGHRRFDKECLQNYIHPQSVKKEIGEVQKRNFLYARVSSKKQEDDLHRQINFLKEYVNQDESYECISDIGSGINFKRKGLSTILDSCLQGSIGDVVIAHRDRLSRFGFDLIQQIVSKAGGNIKVINDNKNQSSEQELADDLLSIVHIFTCRQMGKRKYKGGAKVQNGKDKDLSNERTEENSQ